MTTFVDGPAKDKVLMLKRAPVYLRVVRNRSTGDIDALDQLEDRPRSDEDIFAYQLIEKPTYAFIDGTKVRGRFTVAAYGMVLNPPSDEVMRDQHQWAAWADERGLPNF